MKGCSRPISTPLSLRLPQRLALFPSPSETLFLCLPLRLFLYLFVSLRDFSLTVSLRDSLPLSLPQRLSRSPSVEASTMAEYTKKLVQCSQYAGKLKFCWDVLFNRLAFLLRLAAPRNAKVLLTPIRSPFQTARDPQRGGFTCLRARLFSALKSSSGEYNM